jgi:pilus assembly protein CpaB
MRGPAVMMVGIAVVVGAATVIGGRFYLAQNNQPAPVVAAAPAKPLDVTTVVVAGQALRFGMELSQAQLKEITWPASAVPPGSAQTIAEFLKGPERRVVIQAMEPNEPVLAGKVTGPGQRAILSSVIAPGMTAVSVTLSETSGVAGLAMPGDRVNVMLTRTAENDGSYTDLLLQNVRLLAVDQVIDQRNEKPLTVRTATLEVMPQDAKRVALASSVGSISLMLRKAGEQSAGALGRITAKELFADSSPDENVTASHGRRSTTVKVTRNGKTEDYSVLTDKRN